MYVKAVLRVLSKYNDYTQLMILRLRKHELYRMIPINPVSKDIFMRLQTVPKMQEDHIRVRHSRFQVAEMSRSFVRLIVFE